MVIGPDFNLESGSKVTTFEDEEDIDEVNQFLEDVDLGKNNGYFFKNITATFKNIELIFFLGEKGFGRLWTKESDPTNSLGKERQRENVYILTYFLVVESVFTADFEEEEKPTKSQSQEQSSSQNDQESMCFK